MLNQLQISNFAIIDNCSFNLGRGLTVLTGETGAGKSIIVAALAVLSGARIKKEDLKDMQGETSLEAIFGLTAENEINSLLAEQGYPRQENLLLRRVFNSAGKSRVYLNGQLANISILQSLGEKLIDISGQHQQQVLLQENNHLQFLDQAADLLEKRQAYTDAYQQLIAQQRQRQQLLDKKNKLEEQKSFLNYQQQELKILDLKATEEETLLAEREKLLASEKIRELTEEVKEQINEADQSLLTRGKKLMQLLNSLVEYQPELQKDLARAEEFFYCFEDILQKTTELQNSIDSQGGRLEEIDERLTAIREIKRKYGSIEGALAEQQKIAAAIESLATIDQQLDSLSGVIDQEEKKVFEMAKELSALRQRGKKKLETKILKSLGELGMKKCLFNIAIAGLDETAINNDGLLIRGRLHRANGRDRVFFQISPNPGEELKKLAKIASGGELSRILLVLKDVLGSFGKRQTISVFDEIDTGIGGAIAEQIGIKLENISKQRQVFCITHLPQIACRAATHLVVKKYVEGGKTKVRVDCLTGKERQQEIARMLAGNEITETALKQAKEFLAGTRQ